MLIDRVWDKAVIGELQFLGGDHRIAIGDEAQIGTRISQGA